MQKRYWMIALSCLALCLAIIGIRIHIIGSAIGDIVQARQPGPGRVRNAAPGSLVQIGNDTLADHIQIASTTTGDSNFFFLAILREHHPPLPDPKSRPHALISPIVNWDHPIAIVVQYNQRMPADVPIGSLYLRESHDTAGKDGPRFPVFAGSISVNP